MSLGSFFSDIFSQAKSHEPGWVQRLPSMPGSPQSLQDAFIKDKWSNPYSQDQNSFDIFAGGVGHPLGSQNATDRSIGRAVGSYFGGKGISSGLGSLFGSGTQAASPTQYAAANTGTMSDVPMSAGDSFSSGNPDAGLEGPMPSPTDGYVPGSYSFQGDQMAAQEASGELGGSEEASQTPRYQSLLSQLYQQYPKSTLGGLGALALLSTYSNYKRGKASQQASQDRLNAQQARINQSNVNPNTGGANPAPTTTPYFGTPNYNPFIQQSPTDRLAFGPANWQVQQAHGGPAGQGPLAASSRLVQGPGGGQADAIPARLSQGEYIFSAQDVSDLGDGSTHAGAQKLDQMRELIRHRAGRKNVKEIAPKQPDAQHYVNKVMP